MSMILTRFILIAIVFLGGCATPKNAIYLDPAFHQKIDRTLYVLPAVDHRLDKSTSIDIDSDIRKPFSDQLRDKGYEIVLLNDFGGKESMPATAVAEMSTDELYALGPQQAKSVLLLYLDDVSSKYVIMGYTYKVEITGILLDKHGKAILWKDKGVGSSGQGGLISGLMAPLIKSTAIDIAVNNMVKSFPNKTNTTE
jgi:hypothetical protein